MIVEQLIKFLRLFIKPEKSLILYHSFPDFSDNSFSFFCYIINNHKEFNNIWLVNDNDKDKFHRLISKYTQSKKYKILKKKSILGFYYYCKSKYIFHTHGMFNNLSLSKEQVNINLWHGMPLKKIGHLDGNLLVPESNYVISTSILFQKIMSKAFSLKLENVLISGQPRNDLMFENKFNLLDLLSKNKNDFEKIILWMPTYRKSKIGDIRTDGELEKFNDFLEDFFLIKLNSYLNSINSVCIIKLHPMDFMDVKNFKNYTNLFFVNNEDFENKGISLYSVLHSADLLLTDFSSIYIDYLLLNKPIAFLVSDYNQYSNSRGFVFENPLEFMPGQIIENNESLIPFLEDILIKKKDLFFEKRQEVTNLFHDVKKDFSKNIFNTIFVKNV